MPYRYFEHKADIGIIGEGLNLEKAFEEAAKAMFNIEIDIKQVKAIRKIKIKCQAEKIDELFIEWLNKLLAEADINSMAFADFKVEKIKKEKNLKLGGYAIGEKFNEKKHHAKTEIKAATYAELAVKKEKNRWIAKCVVDV